MSQSIELLLHELCVDLGFCLPPSSQQALINNPPLDIDEFTDAVIRAEGLDPYSDVSLHSRRDIRRRVAKYLSSDHYDENGSSTGHH